MSRLKGSLLVVTLLLFQVKSEKFGTHNFTSEWIVAIENSSFSPTVTTYKDHLIFVSFPLDTMIKLESSKFVNKPCVISTRFDKENTIEENYFAPLYVETLGNHKILIVYSQSNKQQNLSNVWFYVIDPNKCTYDLQKLIFDAPMDSITNLMSIVPYNDSFDIFVKSYKYCDSGKICRLSYDDKASMIAASKKSSIPFIHENWDILPVRDYHPSEGYLYVLTATELNATMIKILDQDLNVKIQTQVNQSGLASYWFTEDSSSCACFYISSQKLKCIFLDSHLDIEFTKILNYEKHVQTYSTIRLGSTDGLIFTILSDEATGKNDAVYVQYLSTKNESVLEPVKFQEFICSNSKMSALRLMEDLFCTYVVCQDMINVKCVGPVEKREF